MATLQHLIDDLVDVNQLQNGKFNMNFAPVQLDRLLAQVVESSQVITAMPLSLESNNDGTPLWVSGDALRLQQVFTNLINNAIIHAPASPRLSLSLRRIVEVDQSDTVEIRVQDYGEGIKAEHLSEVFNRLYQIIEGGLDSSSGLGLGLFICQQIVIAHGGTIRVESPESEVVTFIVCLPLVEASELVPAN